MSKYHVSYHFERYDERGNPETGFGDAICRIGGFGLTEPLESDVGEMRKQISEGMRNNPVIVILAWHLLDN